MNYKPPPKQLSPGSRVIVYLRDSGGTRQELSTHDQRAIINDYCKEHGLILLEVFEDAARTGKTTARRDEFDRMVDLCREDNFTDGVLLWNYARFARNVDDAQFFKGDLRRRGIVVHSVADNIPDGQYARMVEVMIDVTNEEKSRQTSEDSKRGLAQKTLAGFAPGGVPPRGYKAVSEIVSYHRDNSPRIGTHWEIDPELGPLATLAFRIRAQGKSINEVINSPCGILYKTKAGWVTFFKNESYLGIGKCGKTKVENHHPALVDRETWDAVQKLRQATSTHASGNVLHPKRYHSPSLLSGLAVCIHCGTPIIREVCGAKSTKTGKWIAYLCGKKRNSGDWHACEGKQIQAAKADQAIVDAVLNLILTIQYAREIIDQVREKLSDNGEVEQQEKSARVALSSCVKSISRLLDTIESTDSATAKERLKDRENERAHLQFELSFLTSQRKAAEIEVSPEALDFMLKVWRGEIEAARDQNDIRSLQRFIRMCVSKIELGYNHARIWYTFPIEAFAADETRLTNAAPRDRQE